MINIERAGEELGQVYNDGDSFMFYFIIPHIELDCEIENPGFEMPDFSSLANLIVDDVVEFPLLVRAQNQYTPPGMLSIQYDVGNISLFETDDSLQITAIEPGTTVASFSINGIPLRDIQVVVRHPPIAGMPRFWEVSDSGVKLPVGYSPTPADYFNCVDSDENTWRMSTFTPEVSIRDYIREVQILPVTFSKLRLGLRYLGEPSMNDSSYFEYKLNEFCDSKTINPFRIRNPNRQRFDFVWVDVSGTEYVEIPVESVGSNDYVLHCRDSNDELHLVHLDDTTSRHPISLNVQCLDWDFSSTLEEYIVIQDVVDENGVRKEIKISAEIMNHLPKRLSLNDFEVSLSENPIDSEISGHGENEFLIFYLECSENIYQYDLEIHCDEYSETISVQFDDEIDSKNSNLEAIELSLMKRGSRFISLVVDYNEMQEMGYFDEHKYRLSSANHIIAEFSSNQNSIEVAFSTDDFDIENCRLEQIWHPYSRANEINVVPSLNEISSDWIERLHQHEWLRFHRELSDFISDLNNEADSLANDVVNDWIYLVTDQKYDVSNVVSQLRHSLVIAFPENGDKHIGWLYDLPLLHEYEGGVKVHSVGYRSRISGDANLPLACNPEMFKDYSSQFDGSFLCFPEPGIYILCNADVGNDLSRSWPVSRYFGPSDEHCFEAYAYDSFFVFEVVA